MQNQTSTLGVKNSISKIILIFLFIVFLLILSFYTFLAGDKKELDRPDFKITKVGEKVLSGAVVEKIDFYTVIYFKYKDYEINGNNIKLGTGVYLVDSRDVFSEKIIDMGTNKITLKGGGLVYINNNKDKKTIVSFNNKIKINFINQDKTKKGVELFLYPHMYFSFRPYRFSKLEKADSLRVSQLATLKYFNEDFKNIDKFSFIKEENKNFLKLSVDNLLKNEEKYSKILEKIKNKDIGNIVGVDFVEKYFIIFYNDRKKVVYYKNITLNLLIKLLNSDDNKNIGDIIKNINLINSLDQKEAENMKQIIKEIFYLVSYDLSNKSDLVQNRYDLLVSKIFKTDDTRKIKLIKNVDRYNYLGDFSKYIELSILDIENKDLTVLEKEYYILFKQNLLTSNILNYDLNQDLYNILLKGFVSYSNNIEKEITVENRDAFLVNVIYNIDLLKKIEQSFRERYFQKDRDSQGLLVLKSGIKVVYIEDVTESIKNIAEKYKKAKKYLEENTLKYGYIIKDYKEILPKIKEYTDALNNYTLYKKKYSKVNKELLGVKVFEDDEEILTKAKFFNFINNFSGINLSTIDVEVGDYYYKVNNFEINGKNFSFELLPDYGNTIQNIIYKNTGGFHNLREKGFYHHLESTSYILDKEKEKYRELFSKAKNEEKEKYDFRNFFKNSFIFSDNQNVEIFEKEDKNNNDDEIIQTFKRAKLLGNRGEFRNIRNILDIKYSNLDVERKTGKIYLIKINDAKLNISVDDGNRKTKYGAEFYSNYKLEDNKHYFYNIKLKPYIERNNNKQYIFDNIELRLSGKIDIQNFEEKITELFNKIKNIEQDYKEKSKKDNITKITYSIISGKYYIK